MIKINLLPVRASQKKEKLREQLLITVVGLALVIVGCAAAYTTVLTQISQKNVDIAGQLATVAQLEKQIGKVEQVQKFKDELQSKLDVLARLKANKSGPAHMLDELSNAVPDKVWIDTFEDIGGVINLTGLGVSEEVVANFLKQLEASPYVEKVELQSLEQIVSNGNKLQKFKILAREEPIAPVRVQPEQKAGSLQQNKS